LTTVWASTSCQPVHHQELGLRGRASTFFGDKTGFVALAFLRIGSTTPSTADSTLNLTAKVSVGGVDDVDVCAFPGHCTVFGQNCDAASAFQSRCCPSRCQRLFIDRQRLDWQQLVHHGGFAMVNVRNDGDVTDLFDTHDGLSGLET
jgi:hypothetical protein